MTIAARHLANEQRSVDEHMADVPEKVRWATAIFGRLKRVARIPPDARVLDVGAAGGGFLVACAQLGYRCVGVEPWAAARQTASELGERLHVAIEVREGSAESIPFEDESFDVVHASSVIEHVLNLDKSLAEIHRVLKPGGVFWFNAASAMCPKQDEIRGFPLFGWYPNSMKLAIMDWVKDAKPELVGFSRTPAINWFTPWKAQRILRRHGFRHVFDRWELRGEDEGGAVYRTVLRTVRASSLGKTCADVVVAGCSYAAIK
jgi:ubiquinone/menaquinone biosynthesis C-methylase UbiE